MKKKDLHGGNIWSMAWRYGFRPEDMFDFSASINPLGIHENIKNDGLVKSLFCHPELVSGSYNTLILLDAETSSA